jgi:hypothetical protein
MRYYSVSEATSVRSLQLEVPITRNKLSVCYICHRILSIAQATNESLGAGSEKLRKGYSSIHRTFK